MNIIDSHAKSLEASINALMHRSAINVHKDKESLFDERKRLERSRPRFSKSNDEDPPVISTLLQGRFSPRGRDEGETRERRGRDEGETTALMHRQVLITGCALPVSR